jgi:magnesium transporter
MIRSYWRPKDRIIEGDLSALKSKKIVWVDCYNPTDDELKQISELTKVTVTDLKEHLVDYERPNTFEFDTHSLIVFGAPVLDHNAFKVTSFAIFLFNNKNIVTVRTEQMAGLEKFSNKLLEKNPKYFDFHTKVVRSMIESVVDDYFAFLDVFQEEADTVEEAVFTSPHASSIQRVFKLKKQMLFFHKSLLANREVITAIEKAYVTKLSRKELYDFRDIYNDIVQLIDTEETLRDILTGVIDIYLSSVSNTTNQVIKKLTVVASYIMIPTLIASIYGMNFKYLPEVFWKWGYPFALCLMFFSIMVLYFYFKKVKWL